MSGFGAKRPFVNMPMPEKCQELTSTAIGSQSLEFNWAVRPHPKWSEPTVVKCHFGNKGRKECI